MKIEKERIDWLDSLRGLAAFLVVVGHVAILFKIYWIESIIYFFHMPLFFMISGITYQLFIKCNTVNDLKKLFWNKILNLCIPAFIFISFSILIFKDKKDIFYYYNCAWFLIHLALIMTIVIILHYLKLKQKDIDRYVFISAILLWFFIGVIQIILVKKEYIVYSKFACEISKFFGYFICFYLGKNISSLLYKKDWKKKIDIKLLAISFLFLILLILFTIAKINTNDSLPKIMIGIPVSILIIILFYRYKKKCNKLERLCSKFSMEIYLIHNTIIHGMILLLIDFEKASKINIILLIIFDISILILIGLMERKVKLFKMIFRPTNFYIDIKNKSSL